MTGWTDIGLYFSLAFLSPENRNNSSSFPKGRVLLFLQGRAKHARQ